MKIGEVINGALRIGEKGEAVREKSGPSENRQTTEISTPREMERDSVSLKIKDFVEEAKSAVRKYPEIREERVRELQTKIREGTYQVSNRDLARAMMRSLLTEFS